MKKQTIKKVMLLIATIMVIALSLTACNKTVFDTKYSFDYAYIKIGDGDWQTVKIKKWNDYEGEQFQLILEDNTVIVIHSLNCILYNGTLPKEVEE